MNGKLLLFIFIALYTSNGLCAQRQQSNRIADSVKTIQGRLLDHEKNILKAALAYQDYAVATNALYRLMELDAANKTWKDSLCITYFKMGAYRPCLVIASELLAQHPDDQRLMALAAFSEKNLGLVKEALDTYEKLYLLSKDLYDLYEIAGIQFTLKRLGECERSIDKLIDAANSERMTINLSYDNGQNQTVPIKAAALNLKGAVLQEYNKKNEAIHYFEEALKIYSEFTLAKKNLELLQASNKK